LKKGRIAGGEDFSWGVTPTSLEHCSRLIAVALLLLLIFSLRKAPQH